LSVKIIVGRLPSALIGWLRFFMLKVTVRE
jgi:hypothetical protein